MIESLRQVTNTIRNTSLNKTALAFSFYQPHKDRNFIATYMSTEDSK